MDITKTVNIITSLDKKYSHYPEPDIRSIEPRHRASRLIWKLNKSLSGPQKIILHHNLTGYNQIIPNKIGGYIACHIYRDVTQKVYPEDGYDDVSWFDIETELEEYEYTTTVQHPLCQVIKWAAIFLIISSSLVIGIFTLFWIAIQN